ncbi:MAG: hypothetical protein IJU98_12585, partial [Synergistaceae bacterium]|nr:hypothetical protein [Synergistaceae bacterium]
MKLARLWATQLVLRPIVAAVSSIDIPSRGRITAWQILISFAVLDVANNSLAFSNNSIPNAGRLIISLSYSSFLSILYLFIINQKWNYPMFGAIRRVPRAVAKRLSLIPLSLSEDGRLLVTMADPLNLPAQDEIRMLTGRALKVGVSAPEDIEENLDRLYNLQDNLEGAIVEAGRDIEEASPAPGSEDAPLIALVDNFIQRAVREGASDIHVEPGETSARVRFRVDGQLFT